jgi:hypothetical protein
LPERKGLHVGHFGAARDGERHFAEPRIVGINEGDIQVDRLAPAGVGKMLFDSLPVRLVC